MDENKGSGVTVAVIDTGISQVPDLKDTKFVKGYDFVNDRVEADDDNGHGTHVAGTIAHPPTTAMAWLELPTASLMPLKVLVTTVAVPLPILRKRSSLPQRCRCA